MCYVLEREPSALYHTADKAAKSLHRERPIAPDWAEIFNAICNMEEIMHIDCAGLHSGGAVLIVIPIKTKYHEVSIS
jgi:hypothetical protein